MGNVYTVTTTSDNSDSGLTLSEAINDANTNAGSTIDFSASVFTSGNDAYTLTGELPKITADVTIDGATTDGQGITLDGGGQYQGLYVYSGTAEIENLTLAHTAALGQAGSNGGNGSTFPTTGGGGFILGAGGGGGGGAGLGGGLLVGSQASVTLSNVAFESDSAKGGQGGSGGFYNLDDLGNNIGGLGGGFEGGTAGGSGGQKGAGGSPGGFGAGGGGGGGSYGAGSAGGFGGGGGGTAARLERMRRSCPQLRPRVVSAEVSALGRSSR